MCSLIILTHNTTYVKSFFIFFSSSHLKPRYL
nr:MAG TPA: hypothetical protein [Caudoviricetes sp.]DAK08765.1 MAG TPA: hypothetical protein [Caudoviricetes sp.]